MQPIGSTLRTLRETAKLSQIEVAKWLSEQYKETKSRAVSAWEVGDAVPGSMYLLYLCELYRVHDVLGVFMDKSGLNEEGIRKLQEYAMLLEASGQYTDAPAAALSEPRTLKLYNIPASAGTGQFLDSDDWEPIEADGAVPASADFAVYVSGDSMLPRFTNGQVVWVHGQPTIESGEFGVFFYDGESYIKKFVRNEDGIFLVSLNRAYEPIDVTHSNDLEVFGKVVG